MPARLSVVIPSHNRADLLRLCLASVLRRAPAGTEVVVVDDASPDGAVSDAAAAFRGVRVLRQPRQGGFCAAANAGINAATHPIVELLNDDTEVEESWAEAALKWFNDPSVGAVAPLVLRHQWATRSASRRPTAERLAHDGHRQRRRPLLPRRRRRQARRRPTRRSESPPGSPRLRRQCIQRLLPPRRRPRGRRLSRILRRLFRGRGFVFPSPSGRLAHRLRTGRARLAPRLRLLRSSIGRSAGTAGAQRGARLLRAICPIAPSFAPCRCIWPSSPPRPGADGARANSFPSSAASWVFWARSPTCCATVGGCAPLAPAATGPTGASSRIFGDEACRASSPSPFIRCFAASSGFFIIAIPPLFRSKEHTGDALQNA